MALADCQILGNPEMLSTIRLDIREAEVIYLYAFKVQGEFFSDLFSGHIDKRKIYVVANHSEERILKILSKEFVNLHAATWSKNRMWHSKVYIFPSRGIAYVGSHNLTLYAFTSGINHSIRIQDGAQVDRLCKEFWRAYKIAQEVSPYDPQDLIV